MAGLDLTERKLAEIGLNVVVIIHDLVQLSRVAQSLSLKNFVKPTLRIRWEKRIVWSSLIDFNGIEAIVGKFD